MFLHCAAVGAWKLEKEEIREYGNIGWAELAGFACLFLWADWVRYLKKRSVGICGCEKVHIIKKIRKCVIYFMEYVSNIMRMCELWQQKCCYTHREFDCIFVSLTHGI